MPTSAWACYVLCATSAAAALSLLWLAFLRDRSRGRRRCPRCWYDLRGLGLTCPECGHTILSERATLRTRRHWRPALLGLALALYAAAAALAPDIRENGWAHRLPSVVLVYLYPWAEPAAPMRGGITSMTRPLLLELLIRADHMSAWLRRRLAARCLHRLRSDQSFLGRREAYILLGACGRSMDGVVPELQSLVEAETDANLRAHGYNALAATGAHRPEIREMLERVLRETPGDQPHVGVIKRLPDNGPQALAYVPLLTYLLEHGEQATPAEAAWKLSLIGPPAKDALPTLDALIGQTVNEPRLFHLLCAAACIRGQYASDAAFYAQMLSNENSQFRVDAASLLASGEVRERADVAIPQLIEALGHPRPDDDPLMTYEIIMALRQQLGKSSAAIPALSRIAQDPATDPKLASLAREAVDWIRRGR